MPVSIGLINLSEDLLLPGVKNLPSRAGSVRSTVTGKILDQSIPIGAGNQLVLTSPGGLGLFTGEQIDKVNLLKSSREKVVFTHHIGSWTVVVDKVEVTPGIEYAAPEGGDNYYGTVTLIIVE